MLYIQRRPIISKTMRFLTIASSCFLLGQRWKWNLSQGYMNQEVFGNGMENGLEYFFTCLAQMVTTAYWIKGKAISQVKRIGFKGNPLQCWDSNLRPCWITIDTFNPSATPIACLLPALYFYESFCYFLKWNFKIKSKNQLLNSQFFYLIDKCKNQQKCKNFQLVYLWSYLLKFGIQMLVGSRHPLNKLK